MDNEERESKYEGVTYRDENRPWFANVQLDGKDIFLGKFATEEDAHKFIEMRKEIHRLNAECARLNGET